MNQTMDQQRSAIAVIRVSTDQQDCERQRRDVALAARIHGLRIIRTLELEGVSGTKMLRNVDMQKVYSDLGKSGVDGVVLSAVDRLIRPGELGDLGIFDYFQRAKKKIFTPSQELDLGTNTGFLTSGIQGVIAGFERQMILSRTLAGKETLRQRGGCPSGPQNLPRGLGHSKETGWYYVEPAASQVRRAYDLLFAGKSYGTIAAEMGGAWPRQTLRTILKNPCWMGVRSYTHNREEALEIQMGIEPLISAPLWEKAQRLMLGRHGEWRKTQGVVSQHLLSGVLRCTCGRKLYLKGRGRLRERAYYTCSTTLNRATSCGARAIQQPATDAAVSEIITTRLIDPAFLRQIMGRQQAMRPARAATRVKLDRQRANLLKERQKLLRMTLSGTCTEADFRTESKRIEGEIRVLDQSMPAEAGPSAPDLSKVIINLRGAVRLFGRYGFEKRRAMLRDLVREIVIDSDRNITGLTLNGALSAGTHLSEHSIGREE